MKQKLTNISLTFLTIIILGVVFSLIVSLLSTLKVISIQVNDNLLLGLSLGLFFMLGLIFGLIEKKKGLLKAFKLVQIIV